VAWTSSQKSLSVVVKNKSKKMKKLQLSIVTACLTAAMSASASITISGSDLSGLTYNPNDGSDGGVAQYVNGTPDYVYLYTPDSGLNGDSPAVKVKAGNIGLPSLGNLNSFSASYDLLSSSGPGEPYFLTYLNAPDGGYVGVITAGGPVLNSSSVIHVIYSGASGSDTYWGDTLSQLDSISYEGTTFGQLGVYETIIEIGDWDNGNATIAASADIDSITISSVPEASTVFAGALLLLPFGLSTLRILRRNRMA
jgi:hypothetical protein